MIRSISFALLLGVTSSISAAELPPLPKGVSSLGAVECDGYVYVYGGHSGKTHVYDNASTLGSFQRLKLSDPKSWEELPAGPILQGLGLASYEGKIIRVGGMMPRNDVGQPADMLSVPTCAIYDPKAGRWEALPDLPAGRSSHDIAIVGKTLYVLGGWNSQGKGNKTTWHNSYLTLDLSQPGAKWQTAEQPFERRALTTVVIGEKLYVVGGLTASASAERTINILDTTTGKWSEAPGLPGKSSRVGFSPAAANVNGQLIVNTLETPVYRLSQDGKNWEQVGQSSVRRLVHRMIPLGKNMILLVGGTSSGMPLAELETVKLAAKGTPVAAGDGE